MSSVVATTSGSAFATARATVVSLDEHALVVRDERGVDRRVSFTYAAEHLDYGYALTGHAAQGLTVDRAFLLLHDQGALQEWGYVACSRARLKTRLYLADRDALERETPLRQPDPVAPPERAAHALERPAAEPLALDHPEHRDTVLKLVREQRERLERQRERSAEQLVSARRELEHLRRWNRARRVELQAEIALHREALGRVDKKCEQLRRTAEDRRIALTPEREQVARSPRPEQGRWSRAIRLERKPLGRGLEL